MSFYEWLVASRTKEHLARELVALAKENVALKDRAGIAETELFWMKVSERTEETNKMATPITDCAFPFCPCKGTDCSARAARGRRALRIYVAGPMTGYPQLNFPAFHAKAAKLRAAGHVVINPAEINGGADELAVYANMTREERQAHWFKCMRRDLTELCTCDGIAMLDGWTKSKGATLEHHVAKSLGLIVFEAGA